MMSRTGRKRKRNRRGYTLIELILSALIITILIGISAPLFRRHFSDLELRNASYNLAKLIIFAREKAVGESRYYKINFDFEKARFWLTSGDNPGNFKKMKSGYGRVYSLPEGFKISAAKTAYIFYPDGSSEKIDIIIRGGKSGFRIKSEGRLGRVEIKRIEEE